MSETAQAKKEPARLSPESTDGGDDPLLNYKSFNIFALAGFVLGAISVVSLIDRVFWLIPAVGTVMSIYGLWVIGRSDSSQVGKPLAVLGLCLSAFFLFAAPTEYFVRQTYVRSEARAVGDRWFEYLRNGDIAAAYDMSLSHHARGSTGEQFDRLKHSPATLGSYADQYDVVRNLLDRRGEARVEFSSMLGHDDRHQRDVIRNRYEVRWSANEDPQYVDLFVERHKDVGTGQWYWQVTRPVQIEED